MKKMLLEEFQNVSTPKGSDGVIDAEVIETENGQRKVVDISEIRADKSSKVIFKDDDDFTIKSATIISVNIAEANDRFVATLSLLCKSNTDKLFILSSNYLLESEDEIELIEHLPFYNRNYFTSIQMAENMLLCYMNSFVTDFVFGPTNGTADEDKNLILSSEFTTNAVSVSVDGTGTNVKFKMSTEMFASLAFFDNYILESYINNYELSLALIGARINDHDIKSCFVPCNDITLLNMAKGKNTSIVIEFATHIDKEEFVLLTSFNIGMKFKAPKFKKCTVDKLEKSFLKSSNEYLSVFMFYITIKDNNFLVIKAKNKDSDYKLFLISDTTSEVIKNKIIDY